jgi:serine O-acetyltransferase
MYRRAHRLWLSGHTWTARWLSQLAARKTGIEIHPGATIGKGFFIDHGTGVVIGETCEIGDNVTLYQGVTLGGTGKEQGKRHPTLEDGVMVSAGAKVLGSITIGKNSKIGAGAVVIKSVPENCTVVGVPGRIVRMKNQIVPRDDINQTNLPDPILMDMKVLERANNELINRMISLEAEVKAMKAGKTAATAPLEEEKARESFRLKPDERDFVEVGDCIFADNI